VVLVWGCSRIVECDGHLELCEERPISNDHDWCMRSFVAGIGFLRFSYYGSDLVGEFLVARTTEGLHRWPSELIGSAAAIGSGPFENWDWYYSSLAVTVLPSILGEITQLPMMQVFFFKWVCRYLSRNEQLEIRTISQVMKARRE